ncbi:hypothetical protein KDL44_08150 [bacterium]|nr:hypothetical protein [bacterium]
MEHFWQLDPDTDPEPPFNVFQSPAYESPSSSRSVHGRIVEGGGMYREVILCVSESSDLICYDATTLEALWVRPSGYTVSGYHGAAAVASQSSNYGFAYYIDAGRELVAVRLSTGIAVSSYDAGSTFNNAHSSPVVWYSEDLGTEFVAAMFAGSGGSSVPAGQMVFINAGSMNTGTASPFLEFTFAQINSSNAAGFGAPSFVRIGSVDYMYLYKSTYQTSGGTGVLARYDLDNYDPTPPLIDTDLLDSTSSDVGAIYGNLTYFYGNEIYPVVARDLFGNVKVYFNHNINTYGFNDDLSTSGSWPVADVSNGGKAYGQPAAASSAVCVVRNWTNNTNPAVYSSTGSLLWYPGDSGFSTFAGEPLGSAVIDARTDIFMTTTNGVFGLIPNTSGGFGYWDPIYLTSYPPSGSVSTVLNEEYERIKNSTSFTSPVVYLEYGLNSTHCVFYASAADGRMYGFNVVDETSFTDFPVWDSFGGNLRNERSADCTFGPTSSSTVFHSAIDIPTGLDVDSDSLAGRDLLNEISYEDTIFCSGLVGEIYRYFWDPGSAIPGFDPPQLDRSDWIHNSLNSIPSNYEGICRFQDNETGKRMLVTTNPVNGITIVEDQGGITGANANTGTTNTSPTFATIGYGSLSSGSQRAVFDMRGSLLWALDADGAAILDYVDTDPSSTKGTAVGKPLIDYIYSGGDTLAVVYVLHRGVASLYTPVSFTISGYALSWNSGTSSYEFVQVYAKSGLTAGSFIYNSDSCLVANNNTSGPDKLYLAAGDHLYGLSAPAISLSGSQSLTTDWSVTLYFQNIVSAPAVLDGVMYVNTNKSTESQIVGYSMTDGSVAWYSASMPDLCDHYAGYPAISTLTRRICTATPGGFYTFDTTQPNGTSAVYSDTSLQGEPIGHVSMGHDAAYLTTSGSSGDPVLNGWH